MLRNWPKLGFGWNLLAASFQAKGKLSESAEAYDRAFKVEPENYDSLSNYGNVLRELGNLSKSESILLRAVKLNPDIFYGHYNLGLTQSALEKLNEAENSFLTAIKIDSNYADSHNGLGNVYNAQDRLEEAIKAYQNALQINPEFAEFHVNLGNSFFTSGKLDQAEESFSRALELKPDSTNALGNLGILQMEQNRLVDAEKSFRRALEIDPRSAKNRSSLGLVLRNMGKLGAAQSEFEAALELDSELTPVMHNLGNLALDQNRLEYARQLHEQVVVLKPESAEAHRNLGVTLAVVGAPADAEKSYLRALEIEPGHGDTFYRLSEVKTFRENDSFLYKIEALIDSGDCTAKKLAYLHYAVGKAYADIGDSEKSFTHYARGATAKRSTINYEIDKDEKLFDAIADTFSREYIANIASAGLDNNAMIFVLGMPRSGTTLVEHILSSHSAVFGAGERFDIERLVDGGNNFKNDLFPNWVSNLSHEEFSQIGGSYWQGLQEYSSDVLRIIDKMPNNFQFAGFIYGILSGAKIIHVKRNPLDTCVSCFTHLFEDAQNFSYDLEELGRFYCAYEKLMRHWQEILPGNFFLEVNYEDIVKNPEATIKSMLDHCNLEWDPACLAFHQTKRAVPTASLVQVRQPIYNSAMGRWKIYKNHLGPLIETLGNLAD